MRKHVTVFTLLFLATGLALASGGRPRGWFVAASAAFSWLAPGDLNARAEAQQAITDFTYEAGYEAQQRQAAGTFTYALQEAEGSGLKGIRDGFPLTLRAGRVIGPRVAVFAGLQFLGRRRTSMLRQEYQVSDRRPDQVTPAGDYRVEIAYPDYFLAARAWIPQLGVTIDLAQKKNWTAGVSLAAGPMFASLRTIEAQHYKKTDADGYWTESRYVYDMKGKGIGAAVEALARLALPLGRRLSLDLAAGYALRIGSRFSGPGSYEYRYRDSNAARDGVSYSWEDGAWRTRRLEIQRQWGELAYTLSGNDLAGFADSGEFRLDLSGWQLALGLTLAL
ncbi:MAG: hypothetical protein MUC72_07430 [Acidobacteria bacterium]|jgi:hypothetical protein|nr:hypothetical protein [Acidobacteriota bacterium]